MRLTLYYSDGKTAGADAGYTCNPTYLGKTGIQTITVTYRNLTDTFEIEVIEEETTVHDVTETSTKPESTTKPEPTTRPDVTEPTTVPVTTEPYEEPTTILDDEEPTKPSTPPVPEKLINIRTPSVATIDYGDSIMLHAELSENFILPKGAYIKWTSANGNFRVVSYSLDKMSCTITPEGNGTDIITVTVYDMYGNEICSDTQEMNSNASLFRKIIGFFKKLFGLTKLIPSAFKH